MLQVRQREVKKLMDSCSNKLKDLTMRHQIEIKTLLDFMKYALSFRSHAPLPSPCDQISRTSIAPSNSIEVEIHRQPLKAPEIILNQLKLEKISNPICIRIKKPKKVIVSPRKETLVELQNSTVMGCKEQRPIDMMRAELQDHYMKRHDFYK